MSKQNLNYEDGIPEEIFPLAPLRVAVALFPARHRPGHLDSPCVHCLFLLLFSCLGQLPDRFHGNPTSV